MTRYRLTGYTRDDVTQVVGSNTFDPYNQFFRAYMRDCRDDFPVYAEAQFVAGDFESITFDIPAHLTSWFDEVVADLNPNTVRKVH